MSATAASVRRGKRLPTPYLLILPSVILMAMLFGWPVATGIIEAFRGPDGFTLANWERMTGEPNFWDSIRNTLLLIVVVIPVQFVLAFAMALLLQAKLRFSGLYFYLWAVPLAVSDLAAGLVWLAVFSDRGYLNSVLVTLGLGDGFAWLSYQNESTMLLAVFMAELWRSTSLVLLIVVAGLQVVPKEYDEAAQIFGATSWQRLRHVTLPLVKPSMQVALILRTILAFQAFAVAQALTGRDFPLLVGETYEWFVALQNPAVASAVALVVLGMSLLTSVIYLRALRQPEAARGLR
ncbi:carbohydrate ABC transporter permease [Micromonospora sp. DT47]|uniref:carbohydrate ABC transporter permease n=1 Tax=Micromonospora sp. DT47 TaxID=3393431 RepID=UPI003CEFEC50